MVRASTFRNSLLAAVVLAVLLSPLATSMRDVTSPTAAALSFTRFHKIDIKYVAANQSSRQVYCKMCNTGTMTVALIYMSVNGVLVNTTGPLPTLMRQGEYYTCAFTYEGPWEGSIQISFKWERSPGDGSIFGKSVDLEKVSGEPVGEAFSAEPTWRNITFWTPTGSALINQANDRLGLAQDAYADGNYGGAAVLADWALYLMEEAFEAEQTFETGRNAAFAAGAVFTTLVLLRKRLGITVEAKWFSRHPCMSLLLLILILICIVYYLNYPVGISGAF